MDRFLKSSIPQARRGGLNMMSTTFDKPQYSVDAAAGIGNPQNTTGAFGGGSSQTNRRFQSLALANSPRVQFHYPAVQHSIDSSSVSMS